MAKYIFPAVFTEEDEGFSINFPDVKNCFTSAPTITEAVDRAKDVLCLMLYDLEESNGEIPSRSDIKDIEVDSNSFVSLVSCDTLELISSRSQCGLGVSLHPGAVERHINASSQGESGR